MPASAVFCPEFITEHSDLQPWQGYRAGQKVSALNAAAAGRTGLKKPLGRMCWAELEPGQGKLKAQAPGKHRWGHQHTPNLQSHGY